jgi:hypothetical protein
VCFREVGRGVFLGFSYAAKAVTVSAAAGMPNNPFSSSLIGVLADETERERVRYSSHKQV